MHLPIPSSPPRARATGTDSPQARLPDLEKEILKTIRESNIYQSWSDFLDRPDQDDERKLTPASRVWVRAIGARFFAFAVLSADRLPESGDIDAFLRTRLGEITTETVEAFVADCIARSNKKHDGQEARSVLRKHLSHWNKETGLLPKGVLPEDTIANLDAVFSHSSLYRESIQLIKDAGEKPDAPVAKNTLSSTRTVIRRFLGWVLTQKLNFRLEESDQACGQNTAATLDTLVKEQFCILATEFIKTRAEGGTQCSRLGTNQARYALKHYLAPLIENGASAFPQLPRKAGARHPRNPPRNRISASLSVPATGSDAPICGGKPSSAGILASQPSPVTNEVPSPPSGPPGLTPDQLAKKLVYESRLDAALISLNKILRVDGKHRLYELGINQVRVVGDAVRVFTSKLPPRPGWGNSIDIADRDVVNAIRAYLDVQPQGLSRDPFFFVGFDGKKLQHIAQRRRSKR